MNCCLEYHHPGKYICTKDEENSYHHPCNQQGEYFQNSNNCEKFCSNLYGLIKEHLYNEKKCINTKKNTK